MKIIGIDLDGVCGELHRPWNAWINSRFGASRDILVGFTDWDEPERLFGKEVYEFLTPSVYHMDIVKPVPGAVEAVDRIRNAGYVVRMVSSCLNDTHEAKASWAHRHGFLQSGEQFHALADKTNAPVDMLVDDHVVNCKQFVNAKAGRVAVLISQPHNRNEVWPYLRMGHLSDVAAMLVALSPQEDEMTADQSNASHYVLQGAQELLPFVRKIVAQQGTISANDVRALTSFHTMSILVSEQASVITLAFRLAGLVRTDVRVTNRAPTARYRKTFVWALPAAQ